MTTHKRGYPDGLNHFSEIAYFLYGWAKTQVMAFQGEKQIMEAFSLQGVPADLYPFYYMQSLAF